ncbi:MAG: ABC transporter permease [Calditrichaeota bacterium]|jgi:sodium transport system permease protein|nr:ABC transporter permease [Anaerolineae bacterium]MBT7618688.1 ABC transporter permease [Calditrichota bacterium]
MKQIWIIFEKEVLDGFRDTRSWVTGLLGTLIGPILLGAMLVMVGSSIREDIDKSLILPVQNPEYAPGLMQFLESHDVIIVPAPTDPETAVKLGDVDVVLVIPKEFGEDFSSSKPATIQLVMDSSRQSAVVNITKIQQLLEGYNTYIGKLRLVVRGFSPDVIEAISIDKVDVVTPQTRAMIIVSMMPYFIISVIFIGALPIIIDSTAGERERKSLEPLLINPAPRRAFVLGKLLSAFPFSIASLAIILIVFGIGINVIPIEKYLGIQFNLSFMTLFSIFLICLPMVFLASAIQILVASFARTTKEAETYLPFIAFVPALPGLALAFFPVKATMWLMLIPTFGQQLLINQMMRLEPINALHVIASVLATILIAAVCTWLAIILYKRERILFR